VKIGGIIWLRDIVDKLAWKHNVTPDEAEQALRGKPLFRLIEKGHVDGENLYAALGRTEAGRRLIVFFIHKTEDEALIVSAREMTSQEKRRYGK